jgi:hypothetical protein
LKKLFGQFLLLQQALPNPLWQFDLTVLDL